MCIIPNRKRGTDIITVLRFSSGIVTWKRLLYQYGNFVSIFRVEINRSSSIKLCESLHLTCEECDVPKLSSSSPTVVCFPVTPDNLNSKSPSSWTELYRIRQCSSNNPASSCGSSNSIALSEYMLMIRWPAFKEVSRTYSLSSAKPLNGKINEENIRKIWVNNNTMV